MVNQNIIQSKDSITIDGVVLHYRLKPIKSKDGFINDLEHSSTKNWNNTNKHTWYYRKWKDMRTRSKNKGIEVSESWKTFSNFVKDLSDFRNNNKPFYALDKDLLSNGKRIYSKETCVLLPQSINYYLSDKHSENNKVLKKTLLKHLRLFKDNLDASVYNKIESYRSTL